MLIIREREYGEYNDERQGESQEFQSELLVVPKFYPGRKRRQTFLGLQDCNCRNDNEFFGYCNGMKRLTRWATTRS